MGLKDFGKPKKPGAYSLSAFLSHKPKGPGAVPKRPLLGPGGIRKIFPPGQVPSMKEGGMVKKTMIHHLHKGEMVVPAHLVKHFSGLMKK